MELIHHNYEMKGLSKMGLRKLNMLKKYIFVIILLKKKIWKIWEINDFFSSSNYQKKTWFMKYDGQ